MRTDREGLSQQDSPFYRGSEASSLIRHFFSLCIFAVAILYFNVFRRDAKILKIAPNMSFNCTDYSEEDIPFAYDRTISFWRLVNLS